MKYYFKYFLYILTFGLIVSLNLQSRDIIKDLEKTGNHETFLNIIQNNPLFLSIVNNSIKSTIFAPTDKAFNSMPDVFKNDVKENNTKVTTKLILSHIFSGDSLNIENNKKQGIALSLDGSIYYTYEIDDLFVKDIVLQGQPFISGNYRVIPVDCVMFLQQSSKDKRLDLAMREKFKLTTCCLQTEVEFKEFYKNLK